MSKRIIDHSNSHTTIIIIISVFILFYFVFGIQHNFWCFVLFGSLLSYHLRLIWLF